MTERDGHPGPEPGEGPEGPAARNRWDTPRDSLRDVAWDASDVWFGDTEEFVDLDAEDGSGSHYPAPARPGGLFRPRVPSSGRGRYSPGPPSAPAAPEQPLAPRPWEEDEDGAGTPYDSGRLVRLYTLTGGRTKPTATGVEDLDLIAQVVAADRYADGGAPADLGPEQETILELIREQPLAVAEVAAHADLPVNITRILLGDLIDAELVRISRPVPPALLPDERILREVINGLRAL